MPTAEQIAACQWLPDAELAVYSGEYARTGFQGGLQWYRCRVTGLLAQDWATFSGRTIDVPACFIAGRADWGVFQKAGDFETMQSRACTRMHHVHLVEGAGHWVQQEQPEAVWTHLLAFVLR
jgi:pimeloyl-ACP methyl ester carboxylesterase